MQENYTLNMHLLDLLILTNMAMAIKQAQCLYHILMYITSSGLHFFSKE